MDEKTIQPVAARRGPQIFLLSVLAGTVLAGLALASPSWGAVVVEAISRGAGERAEPGTIQCLQFASSSTVEVEVGMVLEPGDEVWSTTEDTVVRLECNDDTAQLLSGQFRAFIEFPGEAVCAAKLASGGLDVLTESDVQNDVGGVVLGNEGTQYAVRLSRSATGAVAEVRVFDGAVAASAPGRSARVHTGFSLRLNPEGRLGDGERRLDGRDVASSAQVYASSDLALARQARRAPSDLVQEHRTLERLHANVLSHPEDKAARAALARVQIELGVFDDAFYHLKRGNLVKKKKLRKNDIDLEELQRGLSPANQIELEEKLSRSGLGKVLGAVAVVGAAAVLIHNAGDDDRGGNQGGNGTRPHGSNQPERPTPSQQCAELNQLLAGRQFEEAASRSAGKIRGQAACSCHYHALAVTRAAAQDFEGKASFCKQALDAHRQDHLLSERQVAYCRPITVD